MLFRHSLFCLVALAALAVPAAAQFDGSPFMVDTSITLGPAPGQQFYSQAAFDGTNYLMVWWDRRDDADIYASRVTPGGIVLDPGGIPVSASAVWQSYPDVAFDGTNFLVVWEDDRLADPSICGCRVTTSGVVLDDTGFVIAAAADNRTQPAVAFDGTNHLVVWEDERNSSLDVDIYGCRVTPAGSVLDPGGIAVFSGAKKQAWPDVARNGANCLVVWHDWDPNEYNSDIRGARVSSAGAVLDPGGFDITAESISQVEPSVASDGTNWLVTWLDRQDIYNTRIYCARVNGAGAVLDPGGVPVSADSLDPWEPAVAFNGSNFLVAWQGKATTTQYRSDIYAARVSTSAQVLDPGGLTISHQLNDEENATVGGAAGAWTVMWTDRRDPNSDIYAARVSAAGQVQDLNGFRVSVAADQRLDPAAAWGGSQWLVVWQDGRPGGWTDIYGARVAVWDTVRDESGFAISTQHFDEWSPAAAWGGTSWLVAWVDARTSPSQFDIYCSRVTGDGQVLDPDGILLCNAVNGQILPDVSFDGTNWLVVWEDQRSGYGRYEVYGARVTTAGAVLDPNGFNISEFQADLGWPAVSFNGTDYLVVWHDEHGGSQPTVRGRRVAPSGTFPDTASFDLSGSADQKMPDVAWDGTNWLVVWLDQMYYDIKARRIAPDGTSPDPEAFVVKGGSHWHDMPVVEYDGHNWLVAWQSFDGVQYDIWGARVTPSGQVLDSLAMVQTPGYEGTPCLAKDAGFTMLLTYAANTADYRGRTYNVRRVYGMLMPYPGVTEGSRKPQTASRKLGASIVRGVLRIGDRGRETEDRAELLDASGRKVLELRPGPNDISRLPPGVYFCRFTAGDYRATEKLVFQK